MTLFAALLARLALASAFLVSGVTKLFDFPAAIAEIHGLTGFSPAAPLAAAVIATQLGGSGLLVAGGRAAQLGAILLGGFTLVATLLAHRYWTMSGPIRFAEMNSFYEHVGLVGAFALVALGPREPRRA